MELSDLTAYAEEKYHIKEEFKWADFPGFSVLREPVSGKWVALLMRQWDSDSGTQLELCDLKCGEDTHLNAQFAPNLSSPFRMRGEKWAGIRFDKDTDREVVFRLFDKAMQSSTQLLFNFALDNDTTITSQTFTETPLPRPNPQQVAGNTIPEKIRQMARMYTNAVNNSFALKCKNFYLQGKFMEDYEDNFRWNYAFWCFLPTYHDLNLRQLRGYFTWRTHLRKGEFNRSPLPFTYLYIYELLNGIGTASPEEAFQKLEEFKTAYLDSEIGETTPLRNYPRWLFDFAVINALPVDNALKYVQPDKLATEQALGILRKPEAHSDEEVVASLLTFAPKNTADSPVFNIADNKGKHLFAETWRCASQFTESGKDLFTLCFGEPQTHAWYPLNNAVYWERRKLEDVEYVLNDYHRFHCHNGIWQETCFLQSSMDSNRIKAFLHETDRQLRKYLKAGSTLREKKVEAWVAPFVAAVIEADKLAAAEAARPKITIDLSGLAQIRLDALRTQNALLTEEDRKEEDAPVETTALVRAPRALCPEPPCNAAPAQPQTSTPPMRQQCALCAEPHCNAAHAPSQSVLLDELQRALLRLLLEGKSTKELLRENHLMPSIVTDTINEALFDEIGDNVLECEDDTISIIEDYREDITNLLGGNTL